MRRAATNETTEGPGQDSFLDIVTNVVGILIILVMVIGVQAKDAWIEVADQEVAEAPEDEIDIETPRAAAASVEADIYELTEKAAHVQTELIGKFRRREQVQLIVTAIQEEMERRRAELDETAREGFDVNRNLVSARDELEQLKQQQFALQQSQGHIEVIEHLPTPLAKTVFGREEHFRLLHGRLAYVPLTALVNQLKREWQQKIWRLKTAPEVTETIGPVRGFRMKYTLERKQVRMETANGPIVREAFGLARFILVPVADDLGEPLADALRPDSDFHRLLQTFDPESTTITVWCYPDTFDSFRTLKRDLYDLGFRSAGRPLPAGHPIGGAPDGSRSVAE